jgi:hypothetical protein
MYFLTVWNSVLLLVARGQQQESGASGATAGASGSTPTAIV